MTRAGSSAVAATVTDTAQAERIARLFAEGHSLDFVAEQGVHGGWTRARAAQVAAGRGWTLDASGRVPRQQRPAVTPGKPLPRRPAGVTQVGLVGGGPAPVVPAPRPAPSPGRAQVAALLGRPTPADVEQRSGFAQAAAAKAGEIAQALAAASTETPTEKAPAAPPPAGAAPGTPGHGIATPDAGSQVSPPRSRHAGTGGGAGASDAVAAPPATAQLVDRLPYRDLLEQAAANPDPAIRALAEHAQAAVADVRAALAADAEKTAQRARIAELEAEIARLRAQVGDSTPQPAPAKPTSDRAKRGAAAATPIRHGTWGGYVQHRQRGQDPCPDCDHARQQTMAARAAKKASAA